MASPYLLASDPAELARLRLQATVWEPDAAALFDEVPVRLGWRCVDVGCGAMGVLRPLSARVGPEGQVIGTDTDPSLLEAAALFAAEHGLGNVTLVRDDVFDSELRRESFDLVHARFLFAPVGREGALLDGLLALLRPGGVLVVQEPDASCWNTLPPAAPFERLKGLILEAFRQAGGDFNAGQRTYGMLTRAGLRGVRVRGAVHALEGGHPYARLPAQFAASLRGRLLGGLVAEAELDALLDELGGLLAAPGVAASTFALTQVWGWKPAPGA